MTAVRPGSSIPLYRQLADHLRHRIACGELGVGEQIPSEAQLGEVFNISRITIRQALAGLEHEGLVERVPGKGTFVRKHPHHVQRIAGLTGFAETAVALGFEPSYRTLQAESTRIPLDVGDRLQIQAAKAFVIHRVLLADGEPIGKHTSYLPLWIVEQTPSAFTRESLNKGSLYRALEQVGVQLFRADEVVEPGLARPDEAEQLEMGVGELVLRVTRTVYDPTDRPVEYVLITYRADSYTYRIALYANRSG